MGPVCVTGIVAASAAAQLAELTGGQTRVLNDTVWTEAEGRWLIDLVVADPFDLAPNFGNDLEGAEATPAA